MADKFACMHCGFVFKDPDMEICPRCGTELGKEWDPAELRSFVVTELTDEQAKFVATLTADSTAEKILAAIRNDGCFALENLTPRQVEAYAEFLKQEGIPFIAESEEQKAVRLQKQLESAAAAQNAESEKWKAQAAAESRMQAEAEARAASEAKNRAEAEARAQTEAAKAQAAAQAKAANALAEAEANLAAEKVRVEAEAMAKAEVEKKRLELEAEERAKAQIIAGKCNRLLIVCAGVVLLAVVFVVGLIQLSDRKAKAEAEERFRQEEPKRKASALADLQVMLRKDPFLTYENYNNANPEKLTLAEFDKVFHESEFAEARSRITRKKEEEARKQARLAAERKAKEEAAAREKARLAAERKAKEEAELRRIGWEPGKTVSYAITENISIEMRYCPAGTFTMGSPSDEEGRNGDEKQHRVTLTKPFLIGKYEVTQAQYQAVMGRNPSAYPSPDRPVECVCWKEAIAFCDELNEITKGKRPAGYRFTLPTEAQWEYACRAGTTTALNSGRNMLIIGKNNAPALDKVGWYMGNCGQNFECSREYDISGVKEKQYDDAKGGTHPVGRKAPNAWGIYDMHGNVAELCLDWYGSYGGDAMDPTGPASGEKHVIRGGTYSWVADWCRAASRGVCDEEGKRYNNVGFRVVLSASITE